VCVAKNKSDQFFDFSEFVLPMNFEFNANEFSNLSLLDKEKNSEWDLDI